MRSQRYQQLAAQVQHLVSDLPDEFLTLLVETLFQHKGSAVHLSVGQIIETLPNPAVRQKIKTLLEFWKSNFPEMLSESLALALSTAAAVEADCRRRQKTELIWTGPASPASPLRRTDQALLQLIASARRHLLIVSFAVYRIAPVVLALNQAATRGVTIDICLETPDASEGRITFDTIRGLGESLARCAKVYIWPLHQRQHLENGRHGSLHAKIAVADEKGLFISSANLTEYAMELNMEMGVLIEGGPMPGQVKQHFEGLIRSGVLKRIDQG